MTLSTKERLPKPGTIVPGKSYAATVSNSRRIVTTKQSLLVKPEEPAGSNTASKVSNQESQDTELRDLKTRIWRHARSPGSYLLDVSTIQVPDQDHLIIIDDQYGSKNFLGLKSLGRANQRYIEIYPKASIIEKFVHEGVEYKDQKIRLFPCKAVEEAGKVIQITLTEIPFLEDADIKKMLEDSLGHFGKILDIGLNQTSLRSWYMGTGYAVIQQDEKSKYPALRLTIPLGVW